MRQIKAPHARYILVFILSVTAGCTVDKSFHWRELKNPKLQHWRMGSEDSVEDSMILKGTDGDVHIRVVERSDSMEGYNKQILGIRLYLDNLFSPSRSPYPGMVTKTVKCPDRFKVVESSRTDKILASRSFALMANARYSYGICDDELAKYNSILSLIFCRRTGKTYETRLFAPKSASAPSELESLNNAFTCD